MRKFLINPKAMPTPTNKYSHGVKVEIGDAALIFVSGVVALNREGKIIGLNNAAIQAEYIFKQLDAILKESSASLKDVVKANIYLVNISDFPKVSEVRNKYFADILPATTVVEVRGLARPEYLVEIEIVAFTHK